MDNSEAWASFDEVIKKIVDPPLHQVLEALQKAKEENSKSSGQAVQYLQDRIDPHLKKLLALEERLEQAADEGEADNAKEWRGAFQQDMEQRIAELAQQVAGVQRVTQEAEAPPDRPDTIRQVLAELTVLRAMNYRLTAVALAALVLALLAVLLAAF